MKTIKYWVLIFISMILVACKDGGGGGGDGGTNNSPSGNNQSYTFSGGSLDDLRAVSPSLTFGHLVIDGDLNIPSSESNVVLNVESLTINDNASNSGISVAHPTCRPYFDAPNVTINASNDVIIDEAILLIGKSGTRTTSTATCNSSSGSDGGDLVINAQNLEVNARIEVGGGWSSSSGGFSSPGADAGNITYNVTGELQVLSNATHDYDGGSGGFGSVTGQAANGQEGVMSWSAASILVEETFNQNALLSGAQTVIFANMTITGNVGNTDDSDLRPNNNPTIPGCEVEYSNSFTDFVEDWYAIDVNSAQNVIITSAASGDIDIFLKDTVSCNNLYLDFSNGATGNESISANLQAGLYYLGVSYSDEAAAGTTDYTITLSQ